MSLKLWLIQGDVLDGDCAFNVNDVTSAQTFATAYTAFVTGSTTTNPLLTHSSSGCTLRSPR